MLEKNYTIPAGNDMFKRRNKDSINILNVLKLNNKDPKRIHTD